MSASPKECLKHRVLVVDDVRLVADSLALIFERNGFSALACYSGEDALGRIHAFSPDLLLCDISMPGMDGLTLVQQVARELPSCRIIVLTGFYSNLAPVHDQLEKLSRPDEIFLKPCQPAELLQKARTLLAAV
jgi:CheY-like chemotaxis protein